VQQMRSLGETDVVFIGDSTVATGVDPAIVTSHLDGISGYNAATAGGVPEIWASWVSDVVAALTRPSVVVIGVGSQDLVTRMSAGGIDSFLTSEGLSEMRDDAPGMLAALKRAIPVLRFRDSLSNPQLLVGAMSSCPSCFSWGQLTEFGFRPQHLGAEMRISNAWASFWASSDMLDLSGDRPTVLVQLIEQLQTAGVAVVVLDMPDLVELRPINIYDSEASFAAYGSFVVRIGEQTGVPIWDAHTVGWTLDDFADPHHLNGRGAEKLSVWVAEQLQQHPDLVGR